MHPLDVLVFGPMIVGLAFWPAIFFWALVFVLFVESSVFDQGIVAAVTLAVALIAAYYLGFWTVDFVVANKTAFLWLLAFYVPAGVIVATVKWWFYTTTVADKVTKYLGDQARMLKSAPDFDHQMRRVRDNLSMRFEEFHPGGGPMVSNHKADLTRWMAWWPFTIIGSLFDDILRRFFTAIYNAMANAWQAISNHAFRNVQWQNPPEPLSADKTKAG